MNTELLSSFHAEKVRQICMPNLSASGLENILFLVFFREFLFLQVQGAELK